MASTNNDENYARILKQREENREGLDAYAFDRGWLDGYHGRVYRHSAEPGSICRYALDAYEQGWNKGREDRTA